MGNPPLVYVIYARLSKRSKEPCIHMEWRLTHDDETNPIRKIGINKNGASYFRSLKNLVDLNLPMVFEDLMKRLVRFNEINNLALGKHLTNTSSDKVTTVSKMQKQKLDVVTFKNIENIDSTASLVEWCHKNRIDRRRLLL
jgi:hypothetical protein